MTKMTKMASGHISKEKRETVKELKLVCPGYEKAAQMDLIIGARQDKSLAGSQNSIDGTKCYQYLSTLCI